MTSAPPEFRLDGPLPRGLAVLEASAGTGKTFTIAGLVVRYVAEGRRLPRLLVVTFTRAATGELRERVRVRLLEAAEHLERVRGGASATIGDPVLDVVASGPPSLLARRHSRLVAALTDFDAATIATIHGFCQQVLAGVGLAGDVDRDAEVGVDGGDLLRAVVDDVVVGRFASGGHGPRLEHSEVLALATAVTASRDARLVPDTSDDPVIGLKLDVARQVRAEVERRKRARRLLDYDDLLARLAAVLADPVAGAVARARLRRQYELALVDEFQDTDPVQWEILRMVFADTGLVLIGDPKQAIYAFRGADVHAYLAAAGQASERSTLAVNWRSDDRLVRACNTLFADAALGDPRIRYTEVRAAREHLEPRLVGAPGAPLRLRVIRRDSGVALSPKGYVLSEAGRDLVARDLAAEAVQLLGSGAELVERAPGGERRPRPVRPGDVAVLVKANADASRVQRALATVGVRSVVNGVGSVFATPGATTWLRLLDAVERPSDPGLAAGVALSDLVGATARELARWDEPDREAMTARLHAWAGVLRDRGIASLLRTVAVQERLAERLLGIDGGERRLTDLEHVGELLHAAAIAEELGPNALAAWLRERIAEASDDVESDERARRLESDDDAVQVLTVHRSKGLEFGVVYLPYLWTSPAPVRQPPVYSDGGRRAVDLGGPDVEGHAKDAAKQARGEDLRLLYVAVTRAQHAAVLWWAPTAQEAPLSRLLLCRRPDGRVAPCDKALPGTDEQVRERLDRLAASSDGTLTVEDVPGRPSTARWEAPAAARPLLARARFERRIDGRWRRTSYSALTAAAHDAAPGSEPGSSEPDEAVTADEAVLELEPAAPPAAPSVRDGGDLEARLRAVPESLGGLPGGVAAGTLVHEILERIDFDDPDLDGALRGLVDAQLDRRPVPGTDREALVVGLRAVLETPLGPSVGELRLRDVARADRLDELQFELPLAGGNAAGAADVTVAGIGALLRRHLSPQDPLATYGEHLERSVTAHVRGFLTGHVDCLLRLRDGSGAVRYVVVDYKTNRLGERGETMTAWHYRPEALPRGMARGHYPLQALLYAVAVHRYLRWRLPGSQPPTPLVLYAFARGMTGADVPRVDGAPCGVFAWQPPPALVADLSTLLDRGTP